MSSAAVEKRSDHHKCYADDYYVDRLFRGLVGQAKWPIGDDCHWRIILVGDARRHQVHQSGHQYPAWRIRWRRHICSNDLACLGREDDDPVRIAEHLRETIVRRAIEDIGIDADVRQEDDDIGVAQRCSAIAARQDDAEGASVSDRAHVPRVPYPTTVVMTAVAPSVDFSAVWSSRTK